MSELPLLLIRIAYLAVLWIFVLSAISVIRSDMFGARVPETARTPEPRGRESKPKKPATRRGAPTHVLVTEGSHAGERAALAVGVVDSSTSRDESWQFFTLGRSIERADMTARLLATRSLTEASGPSWTTILRSCGAYEAYLRTYRGIPSARNAAEFLLLDRLFPRSIIYSIQQAEGCMSAIDPRADRVGHSNSVLRALGRIRNELEYKPVADILSDLPEEMERVQVVTREASEAIRQRFFPTQAEPSWIGEIS